MSQQSERQERIAELERERIQKIELRECANRQIDKVGLQWEIDGIDAELSRLRNEAGGEEYRGCGPYQVTRCDDGMWMVHTTGDVLCHIDPNGEDQKGKAEFVARACNAAFPSAGAQAEPVTFWYQNYRGEVSRRVAVVLGLRWGSSEYHKEPQWLLPPSPDGKGR